MPKVRLAHAFILFSALILAACPPAKVAPTAAFTAVPATGTAPLTVQFTDTSSPGSAAITSWAWSFGDGQTSTARNPSHVYTTAGSFSVTLSVASSDGQNTVTVNNRVTVTAPVPPTANFTATPTSGSAPLAVQFADTSTAGSQPITAWAWTFGDGQTSTAQSPSHTYTTPGTYTVQLTATSAAGADVERKVNLITVTAPPADPVLSLARSLPGGGVYTPGATVDVTVTLSMTGVGTLRAMGMLETLPPGWTFEQVVSGTPPNTVNPSGEFGDLEFVWFEIPTLPITFTYRIVAPLNGAATWVISGLVFYRTGGAELQSETVINTLTPASG
jgi:PKD repeat protein